MEERNTIVFGICLHCRCCSVYLLPIFKSKRRNTATYVWPSVYKGLDAHWKVISAGIGVSLCIEILQFPFYDRVSDIDDLILNSLGFIIGYLLYLLAKQVSKKVRRIK